jgi:hypothetical protein
MNLVPSPSRYLPIGENEMNRNTRKGLGAILAGVGMTTLLGVMSGTGIVRADVDDQDLIVGDEAPTEAEVTMKERCMWYVDGVASEITLTADALEESTVYDGDQYLLSTTLEDYVAWTSGNTTGGDDADAHAWCTFFGEQTGIAVDGVWSGTEFTAEAQNVDGAGAVADDSINMGFYADLIDDPLTLNLTEGTCRTPVLGSDLGGAWLSAWSVGPSIPATEGLVSAPILTLLADDATERPDDDLERNDKCNAFVSVTASIPAGKTPLYAGKPYKFTGPTFTTEISIDSDRSS